MSEFKLAAKSGFGFDKALEESWPGFSMAEITELSVHWMSVGAGGEAALDKALIKAIGAGLPKAGRYSEGRSGKEPVRVHFGGDRQYFMTGKGFIPSAALAKAAFVTDQSDGWIGMRIAGEKTRAVMEKLCGIDLDARAFPQAAAARAPIEGMLALIACEDAQAPAFVVLFQRSSARSMAEHFRHAANSACGGR